MMERIVWRLMFWCIRYWAENYLDQWDAVAFDASFGRVYVKITMRVPDPEAYEELTP